MEQNIEADLDKVKKYNHYLHPMLLKFQNHFSLFVGVMVFQGPDTCPRAAKHIFNEILFMDFHSIVIVYLASTCFLLYFFIIEHWACENRKSRRAPTNPLKACILTEIKLDSVTYYVETTNEE